MERRIEADYKLFQNITPIDDANVQWVFEVMFSVDHEFKLDMVVARFNLDVTKSVSEGNKLVISSSLLRDRYTMLHEAIRHYSNKEGKTATKVWQKVCKEIIEGRVHDTEADLT